jgi:hypothetical protein
MSGSAVAPIAANAVMQRPAADATQSTQWVAAPGAQAGAPPAHDAQLFAQLRSGNVTGTARGDAPTNVSSTSTSGTLGNVVDYLDGLGRHFNDLATIRQQALTPTGDWGMDMARMMEYNWDMSMTANGCQFALSAAQAANNCSRSVLAPDKG